MDLCGHPDILSVVLGFLTSKSRAEICTVSKVMYQVSMEVSVALRPKLQLYFGDMPDQNKENVANYNRDVMIPLLKDYHWVVNINRDEILNFHLACCAGNLDVIQLIYSMRNTTHIIDIPGNTKQEPLINEEDYYAGFCGACMHGHLNVVKYLATLEEIKKYPANSLYFACVNNYTNIIDYLLELGLDEYSQGLYGACISGHFELAKRMISLGAKNYTMALFSSLKTNNLELVKYTMELCTWQLDTDCLLGDACRGGNVDIIDYIISKIDPTKINYNKGLLGAARGGHIGIVNRMINLGAIDYNHALSSACAFGQLEVIKLMIELGATLDRNDLSSLCEQGYTKIIDYIIKNVSYLTLDHYNAGFRGACYGGYINIAKWMIELGANKYSKGLYAACRAFNIQIIKYLIELANKLNIKLDYNRGLLGACIGYHDVIAYWMVSLGANNYNECLLEAASVDNIKMVKYMIELGANNIGEVFNSIYAMGFDEVEEYLRSLMSDEM